MNIFKDLVFRVRCLRTKIKDAYKIRYDKEFIKEVDEEHRAMREYED